MKTRITLTGREQREWDALVSQVGAACDTARAAGEAYREAVERVNEELEKARRFVERAADPLQLPAETLARLTSRDAPDQPLMAAWLSWRRRWTNCNLNGYAEVMVPEFDDGHEMSSLPVSMDEP